MTSKKRRRYGDLAERPLPTEDPALVDEVFAAFTRRPSLPDADEPENDGSPGPGRPPHGRPRAADGVHPERRSGPGSPDPGSPGPELLAVNLWASLPQVEGHLRLPNVVIDHLMQVLDLQEGAVYLQLYRLSHGYGKSTCKIGFPKLAARSGMGRTTVIQVVERLMKKGLIEKVSREIGGSTQQGTVYWVSSPGSTGPERPSPGSPPPVPNKVNTIKENLLKAEASHQKRDYSDCPDCNGSGMYYPEGFDKGVARCKHTRLANS